MRVELCCMKNTVEGRDRFIASWSGVERAKGRDESVPTLNGILLVVCRIPKHIGTAWGTVEVEVHWTFRYYLRVRP